MSALQLFPVRGFVTLVGVALMVGSASAQTLTGIDVSNYQGTINWTSAKSTGITFASCKATEGTTFKDAYFDTNWAQMKAKGIIRTAYHFGRPGTDAVAQAKFFVQTVMPKQGDLQLMLDIETTDGKTAAQVWAWTQAFCAEVQSLTHRPAIIYSYPSFITSSMGNPTDNLNCPLWIANYGVSSPTVPRAWSGWTFWQYSSTGSVSGITGNVDLDKFSNDLTVLNKLTFPREPLQRK